MSMKPGARTRPFASMTRSLCSGLKFPICAMRSPTMRTFVLRRDLPVPSATRALRMTVESAFGGEAGGVCAQRVCGRRQITNIALETGNDKLQITVFLCRDMRSSRVVREAPALQHQGREHGHDTR